MQFNNTSSVCRMVCSPPRAKSPPSPGIPLHPLLPPHPSLWSSHTVVCVPEYSLVLFFSSDGITLLLENKNGIPYQAFQKSRHACPCRAPRSQDSPQGPRGPWEMSESGTEVHGLNRRGHRASAPWTGRLSWSEHRPCPGRARSASRSGRMPRAQEAAGGCLTLPSTFLSLSLPSSRKSIFNKRKCLGTGPRTKRHSHSFQRGLRCLTVLTSRRSRVQDRGEAVKPAGAL